METLMFTSVSISGSNFQSRDSGLRLSIPGNPGESRDYSINIEFTYKNLIFELKYVVECYLRSFSVIDFDIASLDN